MKSARTFALAFFTTLLLLFTQAWSANVLGYAWIAAVAGLLLGAFVWLFLHVVLETLGQFKTTWKKSVVLALLLAAFALTAALSAFYAWTFIAAFVLLCCIVWRGAQDFADIFRRRKQQVGPENWHAVEKSELPVTSARDGAAARQRLARSHHVRITCTPRAGAMGLISHPLRMDE